MLLSLKWNSNRVIYLLRYPIDAKFWVGSGNKPSPQGVKVPDENGKEDPLRKYAKKTIVLTLPGDLTIFDIGHFGVWCEAFTVDFGHLQIPKNLNVPPSLKMLGVSPQVRYFLYLTRRRLRTKGDVIERSIRKYLIWIWKWFFNKPVIGIDGLLSIIRI